MDAGSVSLRKAQVMNSLGNKGPEYWEHLRKFFNGKESRIALDNYVSQNLTPEQSNGKSTLCPPCCPTLSSTTRPSTCTFDIFWSWPGIWIERKSNCIRIWISKSRFQGKKRRKIVSLFEEPFWIME